MREEGQLIEDIKAILAGAGVEQPEALASGLVQAFENRLRATMTDATLPGRDDVLQALIRGILQDTRVAQILK